MKHGIFFLALIFLGCGSSRQTGMVKSKDTQTRPYRFIDQRTYLISEPSTDKTYGYSQNNPIKVGGVDPTNERRFLNALLGPNGEEITYLRGGSCCPFETPNGFVNNMGMLDIYRVTMKGSKDTLALYINMYDAGDLFIPVGLSAKKAE